MTLPQPDKPVITDLVSDIISDIKENQDYIDANYNKQVVVSGTWDMDAAAKLTEISESITGVGFQPSTIIMFAANTDSSFLSWGIYDPVGSQVCSWEFVVGSTRSVGIAYRIIRAPAWFQGTIASVDADGFTFT